MPESIAITNSLTKKKAPFDPLEPGKVKMYVCGPTVYGLTHIGNARPVVFFDIVRRYLKSARYDVTYVSNYTDVDDKIIARSREEKITALEVADKYIAEFKKDYAALGVQAADDHPRVTQYIPQIVTFIEGLVANGSAYVVEEGEVFFSVRKFKEYGKLSGKNIDDLVSGARVRPGETKRDPLDFSLWKPQKAEDEPSWESPWGLGRPGWHIECSVMASALLGETFDIHGGGIDLIHPHHENEIAQSEALTGKPFARVWMHNNMLTFGSEKMSKSVGNILLTRDFVEKYTGETLKLLLISGHYRSPIDFSQKQIRDVQCRLHRFYSAMERCLSAQALTSQTEETSEQAKRVETLAEGFEARWKSDMNDDFNTARALGAVFEYVRAINAYLDRKNFKPTKKTAELATQFIQSMQVFSDVFNVFSESPSAFLKILRATILQERGLEPAQIEAQLQARTEARNQKDFKRADAIRDELNEQGILIRDSASGSTWDVVFSE